MGLNLEQNDVKKKVVPINLNDIELIWNLQTICKHYDYLFKLTFI